MTRIVDDVLIDVPVADLYAKERSEDHPSPKSP